jgi:lysozyme
MIRGIDISAVQGLVDFGWVKDQGFQFVIVKCFTGNDGKDPNYDKNIAGARAAGLKVAAYHFLYPLPADPAHPTRNPKVQAKMHYEAAGDISFVVADLEWPEPANWNKWHVDANFIKQWARTYLEEYERLSGKRMLLYTYPAFAKLLQLEPEFAKYPLWIASYTTTPAIPKPWMDWVLWQDGGGTAGHKLTLPNGIPVDSNVAKDLSLWDPPVVIPDPSPEPPVEPLPEPPTQDPEPAVIDNPLPPPGTPPSDANFLVVLFRALWELVSKIFKK